jgi:hypothetical protein
MNPGGYLTIRSSNKASAIKKNMDDPKEKLDENDSEKQRDERMIEHPHA